MATQHRPGKEHDKQAKPLLELFYGAVKNGNPRRAKSLLTELEKHPPHGLWMHRALALAIEGHRAGRPNMVDLLLQSSHPPLPTERSDFIKLAFTPGSMDLLYTLLENGFRGHRATVDRLLQHISWNPKADVSRMKPAYLVGASTHALVDACASAIVHNAPEHWVRSLNACLPQPLPARKLTEALMHKMVREGDRMERVERASLNLARDLWWTDANLARLEYDQVQHARHYTGKPLWPEATVERYAQALSMIERSGIEEEIDSRALPSTKARARL